MADYLGHSSLEFVDKYVRALAEDKAKAAATLPQLTLPKRPDFAKRGLGKKTLAAMAEKALKDMEK